MSNFDESVLYNQIAEAIRQEILTGRYKPGDRLPPVRKLSEQWKCTPGTIQRAYRLLAREGLLVSRAGQGTQVAGIISHTRAQIKGTLRIAQLVNKAEAFLLEVLAAGYQLEDVQPALDLAMDRWRALDRTPGKATAGDLRFSGSHDMLLSEIAHQVINDPQGGIALELRYSGSLGGLIDLAEGKTDLAGCHLWDAETDQYNIPFVRRLLPGKEVSLVTLAHRLIGLMTLPGNPKNIQGLRDLTRSEIRFVNRQPGSGTRVWLDEALRADGVDGQQVQGYEQECLTHSEVARAVAAGQADTGLGLESAAAAYGLHFISLNQERYDLIMLSETIDFDPVRRLLAWLASAEARQFVDQHPGYSSQETGLVRVVR